MKNKLEVGMYIRTNEGIRKIIGEYGEFYELNRGLHFRYPEGHDLYKEDIDEIILSEPSFKLGELLEVGDFIEHHYISEIKGSTIYTYAGWLIDIDDVEDLVSRILTKEQFESYSYKVGE